MLWLPGRKQETPNAAWEAQPKTVTHTQRIALCVLLDTHTTHNTHTSHFPFSLALSPKTNAHSTRNPFFALVNLQGIITLTHISHRV